MNNRLSWGGLVFVPACAWFGAGDKCEAGTTSCHGDVIRECVVDAQSAASTGKAVMHWRAAQTCGDDAQLGDYTCGVVQGRATCVAQRADEQGATLADGGVQGAAVAASPWLRVDVTRSADGGLSIDGVQETPLASAPSDSAWGQVAAVSMQGERIVDATLVPFDSAESRGSSVWVEGQGVSRVALVASDGQTLAAVERPGAAPSSPPSSLPSLPPASPTNAPENVPGEGPDVEARDPGAEEPGESVPSDADGGLSEETATSPSAFADDIEWGLPPGLKVRVEGAGGPDPTPAMTQFLTAAFARVPMVLSLLLREIVLVSDGQDVAVPVSNGEPDAGADSTPGGSLDAMDSLASGPRRLLQVPLVDNQFYVDMRLSAQQAYAQDTSGLSRELNRNLAERFAKLSAVLEFAQVFGMKKPSDFPAAIADHLRNHLTPLLGPDESVAAAWNSLHGVAVQAKLATPYEVDGPYGFRKPRDDTEAVTLGFATAAGVANPTLDFAEYAASALVLSRWVARPCEALRAKALDELDPPLLVHVAKLAALRGLGLLGGPLLRDCAGALRVASPEVAKNRGGVVMHKPDGERVVFTEELEAIRQPYFGDEVQLSWKAQRAYAGLSLSAGYRGSPPGVLRLGVQSSTGEDEPISRAVFALTNPDGYQTAVAQGGLVVLYATRPDALEAYGLMVVLNRPLADTKIFPLVSATAEKPVWGDAP